VRKTAKRRLRFKIASTKTTERRRERGVSWKGFRHWAKKVFSRQSSVKEKADPSRSFEMTENSTARKRKRARYIVPLQKPGKRWRFKMPLQERWKRKTQVQRTNLGHPCGLKPCPYTGQPSNGGVTRMVALQNRKRWRYKIASASGEGTIYRVEFWA
jgi:hypothetical protein